MVEALTAGTALLHVTGQIETEYLDKDLAYIHEAPDQLSMLSSISKAAFRVRSVETALPTHPRSRACRADRAERPGQRRDSDRHPGGAKSNGPPICAAPHVTHAHASTAQRVDATRGVSWRTRSVRCCGSAAARVMHVRRSSVCVALGFGVVTSVQGRGVLPEDHPATLGAFNVHAAVESFYKTCDAMVVVGSRLRGNETLKYKLTLPQPLYRIDADALADNRGYRNDTVRPRRCALCSKISRRASKAASKVDPTFAAGPGAPRAKAPSPMWAKGLGPYKRLVDAAAARGGPRLQLGARRHDLEQHVGQPHC